MFNRIIGHFAIEPLTISKRTEVFVFDDDLEVEDSGSLDLWMCRDNNAVVSAPYVA
jgi:hypothetical protein